MMLLALVWTVGNGLEMAGADLPTKLFWANLQYLGYSGVPLASLVLALEYTSRRHRLTSSLSYVLHLNPIRWMDLTPVTFNVRKYVNHKGHRTRRINWVRQGGSTMNSQRSKALKTYEPIPPEAERWGKALLDATFEVHTLLGPGFLERIYEDALCYELTLRRVPFERQKAILVPYKDFQIEGQRLDLLIGGMVIAEIKAVDAIHPIHQAQLMSYLKATGLRLGFVINFHVLHLREGILRVVL